MAPTLVVPLNVLVNERRLYLALGRHDMAIAAFAQVLAERPEMIDVHYSLGRALQVVGRDAEAAVQYRALPATSPHRNLAENNLGTLFERAGQIDSALYYYARAGALVEAGENHRRLIGRELSRVKQQLDAGQLLRAEANARLLVAADEDQRDARFLLAVALYLQRRYGESIGENLKLVARHPHFDEGLLQLALVQEASGQFSEALITYQTLLQRTRSAEMERIGQERLRALKERMP